LNSKIELAHGGGGSLMHDLIVEEIIPALGARDAFDFADSARLEVPAGALAFTTDGFVVQPLFFAGGDIGRLAVCGTVNDLAARGARPLGLSLGVIAEQGLPIETLRRVLQSAAAAGREASVQIVTGDTKVIEPGRAGGLMLTTSGVGLIEADCDFSAGRIEPHDVLLINGCIGDHGIAVMSARDRLSFTSSIASDAAPLADLTAKVLDACGSAIKCMKDPTRGGLAASINEMAQKVGFVLEEQAIPVRRQVRGACEMLGLDVLTVANEGKMLFVAQADSAERALDVIRSHPLGRQAAIIGRADERAGLVRMVTDIGGERIIETPYGEQLPRIC